MAVFVTLTPRLVLSLLVPCPRVARFGGASRAALTATEGSSAFFGGQDEQEAALLQLQQRVQQMEQLLPDVDVPALLQREPDLADNPFVLSRIKSLQAALPRASVGTLVRRAPMLLQVRANNVGENLAALRELLPGAALARLLQAAPTLLLTREMASSKSDMVIGVSISSFLRLRISLGLRPLIMRRMLIMLASRHTDVISAPLYPSVSLDNSSKETSSVVLTVLRLILNNALRAISSGRGM